MWVFFALISAVLIASSTFIIKHLLKDVKPIPLVVLVHVFTIPFFILFLFYFGIPSTSIEFYKFVLFSGALSGFAAYTSYKALSYSPVSLIIPLAAFLPILTLIWAYFLLDETPTTIKLIGILTIVIGAYFLDIHDIKKGILQPFVDLFSDKGMRFFLLAVLAWSLSPIFEKQAVFETTPYTPIFVGFMSMLISTLFLLPFAIKDKITMEPVKKYWKWLLLLGVFFAIFSATTLTAFTLTNVAYVVAITRLATIFLIMLGAFILKEKRLKERFLGGFIMIIGAILVAI